MADGEQRGEASPLAAALLEFGADSFRAGRVYPDKTALREHYRGLGFIWFPRSGRTAWSNVVSPVDRNAEVGMRRKLYRWFLLSWPVSKLHELSRRLHEAYFAEFDPFGEAEPPAQ